MADLSKLQFLQPTRVVHGIRRRVAEGGGVRAAAIHGLREAGALIDRALVGPMVMRINPMGYVCNHTCPMCWLQHLEPANLRDQKKVDREEGMKLDDYHRLFNSMPRGLETVEIVGGGEPLVHPQCLDIMAAIKSRGWRGSIITNGSLLREPAVRRLIDMDWDFTRISVHAGDRETYKLVQGVDHFDQLFSNLKTYTQLRTRADGSRQGHLCVLHILQRENLGSIERLFGFAEEVGADSIVFEKIIPYDDMKIVSAPEWRAAREAILTCAQNSKIPCNLDDVTVRLEDEEKALAENKAWVPGKRCSVGFDQTFISALGNVYPCCFSNEKMGNVREQPFSEIWSGEKYSEFRRRLNAGRFADYCINNRCAMKGVVHS